MRLDMWQSPSGVVEFTIQGSEASKRRKGELSGTDTRVPFVYIGEGVITRNVPVPNSTIAQEQREADVPDA